MGPRRISTPPRPADPLSTSLWETYSGPTSPTYDRLKREAQAKRNDFDRVQREVDKLGLELKDSDLVCDGLYFEYKKVLREGPASERQAAKKRHEAEVAKYDEIKERLQELVPRTHELNEELIELEATIRAEVARIKVEELAREAERVAAAKRAGKGKAQAVPVIATPVGAQGSGAKGTRGPEVLGPAATPCDNCRRDKEQCIAKKGRSGGLPSCVRCSQKKIRCSGAARKSRFLSYLD
jgi:hypothetical protein